MNQNTINRLEEFHQVINAPVSLQPSRPLSPSKYYVGVDLGTATVVISVLNSDLTPIAGAYRYAQVARDGLVVDFIGAVDILRELKHQIENQTGIELDQAASAYPPGVPNTEVRATANVLEAAGFHCVGLVDEPTAANYVLGLQAGAIVDVGGGTTGIAVIQEGKVIHTADEATGGVHFSLTVAGALSIPYEKAELMKRNPQEQPRLLPVVRPVMEKVAAITQKNIEGYPIQQVFLVGGTSQFFAMDSVVSQYINLPVHVPEHAMLVTPLGIAYHHAALERSINHHG